ncbi:MAG TPA: 16S rRNA (uracil(1498)-N(3))-methyltransferase [Balneolales bacterium]|nr:16S rRNA (uracil(1498)-N(3))-methyltransferase [Balneolales bacterium]
MNVFYTQPDQINTEYLEITGDEAHHISRVLRYNIDDQIVVVDGIGHKFKGRIIDISKKNVRVQILERENLPDINGHNQRLVLGLGIIKHRQRLEFAVEKAIELGVAEIILFNSRYSEKSNIRKDRIEKIMISAMKQSMHAVLPVLKVENSLEDVLEKNYDYKMLIAHEKYDGNTGIPSDVKKEKNILLLVGPEGGFSEEEVATVKEKGGELISLGPYRLRAETAALAFLALFI